MSDLHQLSRDETLALISTDPASYFEQFFAALEIPNDEIDDTFDRQYGAKPKPDVNGFTLKEVNAVGGGEGEGEHVERTYALIEASAPEIELAHCEIVGYYMSHDGTTWDEPPYVVYPRQVMVTQYFKEKE